MDPAAAPAESTLAIGSILMGVFGGLALFLFGLDQMTDALKVLAGDRMKNLLARLTTNRFKAAFAGAFVTSIIQSSSVTTVLVVGFVSAGLMTLAQSVGVIMGANVGTTVTAQIVAFKVTQFSLIPVTIGFALLFLSKNDRIRHYGHMIMGLGLIFFGMQLMSDGTRPLRDYQPFIDMMQRMDNPLLAIAVSAAFTAVIQSSSATTGIIIVLASQGFITLEAGIALVFGANIGTCITAMLAALGKPREAVRAAVVHVLFNVGGVLIWFLFIGQLAWMVREITPVAATGNAATQLAAETPRQIANAHTIFNIANTLLFIGFTGPMAALVRRLVPDRREVVPTTYLDDLLIRTPSLAMHMIRLELGRLGAAVLWMVREGLEPVLSGSAFSLSSLQNKDNEVDLLHGAIIRYLGQLSKESLSDELTAQLHDSMSAANYLENIGDMVETNLVEVGEQRLRGDVHVSPTTRELVRKLHERVTWSVERAVEALVSSNHAMAMEVADAKSDINTLASRAEEHLAMRLVADEPNRLAAFKVETDLIESLKRIYYFAKRISKIVIESEFEETKPDDDASSSRDDGDVRALDGERGTDGTAPDAAPATSDQAAS